LRNRPLMKPAKKTVAIATRLSNISTTWASQALLVIAGAFFLQYTYHIVHDHQHSFGTPTLMYPHQLSCSSEGPRSRSCGGEVPEGGATCSTSSPERWMSQGQTVKVTSIWRFPKMGIPRSHPKLDHFSIKTHSFLGSPILRNPHNLGP
jgi:hypothetical protein